MRWIALTTLGCLVIVLSWSCKPRRDGSNLASDGVSQTVQDMLLVQAMREYTRNIGIYSPRNAYIDRIHAIAKRSANESVRKHAAASLMEAMLRSGFSVLYTGVSPESHEIVKDAKDSKRLQTQMIADGRAMTHASLLDFFKLTNAAACPTSKRTFAVCDSQQTCSEVLNLMQPAIVIEGNLKATDDAKKDNTNRIPKLLNDVEADIKCLPPRMRTELLKYKLASVRVWADFYRVTNYGQLKAQGITPSVQNAGGSSAQQVYSRLSDLIKDAEANFFQRGQPLVVDRYTMYRLRREQLIDYLVAKELSLDLVTKPFSEQTDELRTHVDQNVEALNADASSTYVENLALLYHLERAMQFSKTGDPDPSTFLSHVRNAVARWKEAKRTNTLPSAEPVLHPVAAVKILTEFPNEMHLPWRVKWYKTAAALIHDISSKDLSTNAVQRLNAFRGILDSHERSMRMFLQSTELRSDRLYEKEIDIARQDRHFHSLYYQAIRQADDMALMTKALEAFKKAKSEDKTVATNSTHPAHAAFREPRLRQEARSLSLFCYDHLVNSPGKRTHTIPDYSREENHFSAGCWQTGAAWLGKLKPPPGVRPGKCLSDAGTINLQKLCGRLGDQQQLEERIYRCLSGHEYFAICEEATLTYATYGIEIAAMAAGFGAWYGLTRLGAFTIQRLVAQGAMHSAMAQVGARTATGMALRFTRHIATSFAAAATFNVTRRAVYSGIGLHEMGFGQKNFWQEFGRETAIGTAIFASIPAIFAASTSLAAQVGGSAATGRIANAAANSLAKIGLEKYTTASFLERSAGFFTQRALNTATFVGIGYAVPYAQALLADRPVSEFQQEISMKERIGEAVLFESVFTAFFFRSNWRILSEEISAVKARRSATVTKNIDQHIGEGETGWEWLFRNPVGKPPKVSQDPNEIAARDVAKAYEILGVKPEASAEAIVEAIHAKRSYIKKVVSGKNKDALQTDFDWAVSMLSKDAQRGTLAARMKELFGGSLEKDYYALFGVRRYTEWAEMQPIVEQKLKTLEGQLVSARQGSNNAAKTKEIQAKIREVEAAQAKLRDPFTKRQYDIELTSQGPAVEPLLKDPFDVL